MMRSRFPVAGTALACALFVTASAGAIERAARNPFLADSVNPMSHGEPSQQDSLHVAGPGDPGPRFAAEAVRYAPIGPAHFGAYTSGPYPDGRRVIWSNGLDRIVKLDFDTYEVLTTHWLPGARRWTEEEADEAIAGFDRANEGVGAIWRSLQGSQKYQNVSSVYTVLDRDNTYFIASRDGSIAAYTDADPSDPASPIVERDRFQLPEGVTGYTFGMNITWDGWLIIPTEHGYVVAVKRDFSEYRTVRMRHSEGADLEEDVETGQGWVRNAAAVDEDGGIYIASRDHMHKLVWTGDAISTDPADGAWTSRYLNGWGRGTGATPSLMGFGDEDRFVVITDGEPLMNVVLFWRDAIPEDWAGMPGAPDRRIAGMAPADMGDDTLQAIQSEQSVIVGGYGALVVNNIPRNAPWYLPARAGRLLIGLLGSAPAYQPYGVQKFEWDPEARILREAWVNREVSSPNCLPVVSHPSNKVYLIGARDNEWTLEALDWSTGASAFHTVIGGQRYNPFYSGTHIDEEGRIHYGSHWGRVRLEARPPGAPAP